MSSSFDDFEVPDFDNFEFDFPDLNDDPPSSPDPPSFDSPDFDPLSFDDLIDYGPIYGDTVPYNTGTAVLDGIFVLITAALFITALVLCRRRGDEARGSVTWLKFSYFFLGLYFFFDCMAMAFIVLFTRHGVLNTQVTNGVATVSTYLGTVVRILIAATLISFGRGILYARAGDPPKFSSAVRVAIIAACAIIAALATAYFGIALYVVIDSVIYSLNINPDPKRSEILDHANRLYAATHILIFVMSLACLSFAGVTVAKVAKSYPRLKMASISFLFGSLLFFIATLLEVIYIGLYLPLSGSQDKIEPEYYTIITFIFGSFMLFLALTCVFHVTRTKNHGLWSATVPVKPADNTNHQHVNFHTVPALLQMQYGGPQVGGAVPPVGHGQGYGQPQQYYYLQQPQQPLQQPYSTMSPPQ